MADRMADNGGYWQNSTCLNEHYCAKDRRDASLWQNRCEFTARLCPNSAIHSCSQMSVAMQSISRCERGAGRVNNVSAEFVSLASGALVHARAHTPTTMKTCVCFSDLQVITDVCTWPEVQCHVTINTVPKNSQKQKNKHRPPGNWRGCGKLLFLFFLM